MQIKLVECPPRTIVREIHGGRSVGVKWTRDDDKASSGINQRLESGRPRHTNRVFEYRVREGGGWVTGRNISDKRNKNVDVWIKNVSLLLSSAGAVLW